MSILRDVREQRRLAQERLRPGLWFTSFSVPEVLDQVRREHFPELSAEIQICAIHRGPLVCIAIDDSCSSIYVHQLLNHSDAPREVFSLICKHELLHLRIAPGVGGKRTIQHPPEFWKAEEAIAPERNIAWDWIWGNLGPCLKIRPALERIDVRLNWKKTWNDCRPTWPISSNFGMTASSRRSQGGEP